MNISKASFGAVINLMSKSRHRKWLDWHKIPSMDDVIKLNCIIHASNYVPTNRTELWSIVKNGDPSFGAGRSLAFEILEFLGLIRRIKRMANGQPVKNQEIYPA